MDFSVTVATGGASRMSLFIESRMDALAVFVDRIAVARRTRLDTDGGQLLGVRDGGNVRVTRRAIKRRMRRTRKHGSIDKQRAVVRAGEPFDTMAGEACLVADVLVHPVRRGGQQ